MDGEYGPRQRRSGLILDEYCQVFFFLYTFETRKKKP